LEQLVPRALKVIKVFKELQDLQGPRVLREYRVRSVPLVHREFKVLQGLPDHQDPSELPALKVYKE
jgi:hypothetical protein